MLFRENTDTNHKKHSYMRHLVIFLLMVFASTSLMAQENSTETQNINTIVFDKVEHNYGEIEYGGDGNCVFTFTNTGKEPLVLTSVRASCGCTAPSWPKDPINPGEQGEIKVRYNTTISGNFNKNITVTCNGNPSSTMLRIKGRVLPKQS